MKLLTIVVLTVGALTILPSEEARQFFKMDRQNEVLAAKVDQLPSPVQTPVVEAPVQPTPPPPPPPPAPTPVVKPVVVSGSCEDWITQAGIPLTNAVRTLIINESGCRPDAVNPSSGACGIPQALPCSKLPCTLQDPVCQLRWMDQYVKARYNTWEGALAFWKCKGVCYSNLGKTVKSSTWY